MSHVLLILSDVYGRRRAQLELGRRLQAAGHRVTGLRSVAEVETAPADESGVPIVTLDRPAATRRSSRRQRIFDLPRVRARTTAAVDALETDRLASLLADTAPDLIVVDPEMHAAVITSVGSGIPVALSTTFFATWKAPMVPPLHHDLVPSTGWFGRAEVEWAWLRYRLWKAARRRIRWLRGGGLGTESMLRSLADRYGVDFDREVDLWQWPLPFSYRGLPLLAMQARELDLPHEPPDHVRYVGPMLPTPPGDVEPAQPEGRPLVYVAFGTYFRGDDSAFVRRVLDALAARPAWDVVVGLGGRISPDHLGAVADHISLLDWAPQRTWLARADVAVVHAGASTINECVLAGCAPLVYPLDINDQQGNAARVEFHRVGMVGDREHDTEATILERLDTLLGDDATRARLATMGEALRRYETENRGVQAVEELLARTG